METKSNAHNDGATAEKSERVTKINLPLEDRAALTPREFAALFGRAQSWGYRMIYSGKVNVIDCLGSMMIPKSELQRLTKSAGLYTGKGAA